MLAYAARKRRISQDNLSFVGSSLTSSLRLPISPQTTVSLHAAGLARIIFHKDPTSFEGVLITDNGEETLSVQGFLNTKVLTENSDRRLVDVSITDGETGQLYIIRRVDLFPPMPFSSENDDGLFETDTEIELDRKLMSNSTSDHQLPPYYELRSDVLQFSTDDILVGNRADKEMRTYLNPGLVGKQSSVHVGRMNIEFDTTVTPPATPAYDRQRRRSSCHVSICCSTNNGDSAQSGDAANGDTSPIITDADINFLM